MQLVDRRGRELSARRYHSFERAGFTLLEILAVILIGALLLSFMVPNISALKTRALREHAKGIVAMVDLGRQRAVVTRTPHRLFIDIGGATYNLEWLAPVDEVDPRDAAEFEIDGTLSLAPPPVEHREFVRLPGQMGNPKSLGNKIRFARIETDGSSVNSGEAYVNFYRDGTSSPTLITLDDPNGNIIYLEILPLADAVRVRHEAI